MTATPARARITPLTDETGAVVPSAGVVEIEVQFNPETLQVTARAQVQQDRGKKSDKPPVQVVTSSERSLSVQLVFDTTLTGADVQAHTHAIGAMMRPGDRTLTGYDGGSKSKKDVKVPIKARFEWGTFAFVGVITEFTETLEYFSADGIPLRAAIKMTMSEQSGIYAPPGKGGRGADTSGGIGDLGAGASDTAPALDIPEGGEMPAPGGDREAARQIARENGVENLRAPEADRVWAVSRSWSSGDGAGSSVRGALGAGAGATASAGAGIGASAGGGLSFGLPASAMASGQTGFGASAGAGAGLSLGLGGGGGFGVSLGGGVSAGTGGGPSLSLSASAGDGLGLDAFAKLSPPKPPKSSVAALKAMSERFAGFGAAGAGAGFGASASASMAPGGAQFSARADVGGTADLARLIFDGED